jgi:cytochrome c2
MAVQEVLRRFLPEVEVIETLAYDWHLDPYSLGTWCVLRKGQMTHYLAALREPEGRVHFAGADLALGWRGFIDGAIESGNRVAHDVIARLEGRARDGAEVGRPSAVPVGELAEDQAAVRQCVVCHPSDASGKHGVGPNLRGVSGRKAASSTDFTYSEALRSRGTTWTDEELDAFLKDPAGYAPGTSMPFAGLESPTERAAVIRFLRSLK